MGEGARLDEKAMRSAACAAPPRAGVRGTVGGYPAEPPAERDLLERAGWFIKLRWLAAAMVAVGAWTGRALGYPVPAWHLTCMAVVIVWVMSSARPTGLVRAAAQSQRSTL